MRTTDTTATPMIAWPAPSPSSPAPSARRYAALGLDRSVRPSKLAHRAADASCSMYGKPKSIFTEISYTKLLTFPRSIMTQTQGDGLPVPVWNGPDQSFAAGTTTPQSHHVGAGGSLIDKHQPSGVKHTLLSDPASARPGDVRPFLFRRAQAFF